MRGSSDRGRPPAAGALYLCYYNVTEPLVVTQVIAYLRELAARGLRVHLLTFEKQRFTAPERRRIREELAGQGIRWHALRYHRRPSLPATLYDVVQGAVVGGWLCARHRLQLAHGRSHVGAAMAWPLRWMAGTRLLFDVRGLLADEYADAGHWTRAGLKYRLTKAAERILFRRADGLVMLTEAIRDELLVSEPALRGRAGDIEVIPCCVAMDRFRPDGGQRDEDRRARGWQDRLVLTYAGKLGSWYLVEEMARFFAVARGLDDRFFFQILTQSDGRVMREALERAAVPAGSYHIGFATPPELPRRLAAADAGLSFIRTCYSKRSSSPTKVGEYLAAGLPVVSTAGIGDCDRILADSTLGVTVSSLDTASYERAARTLLRLVQDPETPARCRRFAEGHLSLAQVGGPRYERLYRKLLGREHLGA